MGENIHLIKIASEFSKTPGPRYIKQGPYSGEKFRNSSLVPALQAHQKVLVDLDGTAGFGSSFIDEAFGGIVRSGAFAADELLKRIEIKSDEEIELKEDVRRAITDAKIENADA
tara:strand:- start:705 stop:1046 length:342 start_codon:yes stop_codon:yes gene_type:complete